MEVTGEGVGFLGTGKAVLRLLDEALLADTLSLQLASIMRTDPVDTKAVLVVHTAGEAWQQQNINLLNIFPR